jgi:hypothetical protein
LSGFQVTPSAFQVNEGDSLTTTLSGFTPGSTLYFKVTGRGINKKDFASGGVKGRVQADSNGVATISHSLRADKATEGDESFAIQVFSDKKMRNLLGESDAVTVIDTSVKAGKGGGSGGNKKAGKQIIDTITGQWAEEGFFISGTGVDEDGPYEDEGPFGYLKSDKLPNGRFIFDQASYNPLNYTKGRWILFDDSNANQEFDSSDKTWGHVILSKAAINIIQKGLDFPFSSSTDNAGRWEAQIAGKNSSGKIFITDFHMFDIQITDPSVFT